MRNILYVILVITMTMLQICNCSAASEIAAADSNSALKPSQRSELLDIADVNNSDEPFSSYYISGDAFNAALAPIFKEYVSPSGTVNYAKLRRKRIELKDYCGRLENLKPEVYMSWSRADKIAFWINAYNICTIRGIIDNYPISPSRFMLLLYPADSIMHICNLRTKTFFNIMGLQYNLEEMERDMLLGRFEEPRACFAISYGTASSPPLRSEPYIGKLLEKQLNDQVKLSFTSDEFFKIDSSHTILSLTAIFKMYQWRMDMFIKLFGNEKLFREYDITNRAILNFIKNHISKGNADILKRKIYSIEFIRYNWSLNDWQEEIKTKQLKD